MTKEVVMQFATKTKRRRVTAAKPPFIEGDLARPVIPGGPLMWVERATIDRVTAWYYSDGSFVVVRVPTKYLQKVEKP